MGRVEVPATEFCCQGLELDHAGVCWGADLVRAHHGWQVRAFRGTAWLLSRDAEAVANAINTYRVLLTRARYETIIWVPRGEPTDATRPPETYDAIADFLLDCGVHPLNDSQSSVTLPSSAFSLVP